jgi:RHS repeat-associated protein
MLLKVSGLAVWLGLSNAQAQITNLPITIAITNTFTETNSVYSGSYSGVSSVSGGCGYNVPFSGTMTINLYTLNDGEYGWSNFGSTNYCSFTQVGGPDCIGANDTTPTIPIDFPEISEELVANQISLNGTNYNAESTFTMIWSGTLNGNTINCSGNIPAYAFAWWTHTGEDQIPYNFNFALTLTSQQITNLFTTPSSSGYGDTGASYAQAHDTTRDPKSGGPVDLTTLGETVNHPLLTLSGARGLEFTISYNSTLSGGDQYITPSSGGPYWTLYTPGDVGHWTHNFDGQAAYFPGSGGTSNEVIILIAHRRWTFFQNGSAYQSFDQSSAYDSLVNNADGSYTLTTKDQKTYTFSGPRLYLTRVTNPHGQAIVISRNNTGQITTITEPVSGKYFSVTYGTSGNSAGRITTVTDSAGRSVGLAYDSDSMLAQITEANGSTTSFTYDSGRHLLTEADARGNILTSNTYVTAHSAAYPIGSVINQMDARGNHFTYLDVSQGNSNITGAEDRNNNYSDYLFDTNHNLIEFFSPDSEKTTYTYDNNGNLLTKTDPLTHSTSYAYDAHGNVQQITDPLGQKTVIYYDNRHNILSVIDPDNNTNSFTYDTNNNLLTATDGLGHNFVRTYNANSLLLTQTDPNGGVITNTYANGLLTSHTDAAGNKETMTYDAIGNLATLTDPTGATTTNHYGTLRQLLEADDAAGNKVVITYDWRLRVSTITDPSGAVTSYAYDGNNNILAITNALQQVTTFAYDNEDRPISVTDPLGNTSCRSYDAVGRLIETTNAAGNTVEYTYDGANNLLTIVDGNGNVVITNAYDACNQLIVLSDALGRTSKLSYDKARLLASTQDPLGLVNSFMHDALGRTTTVNAPLSTTNSQTFDADGNRTTIINANNKSTAFTYDLADRLTKVTTATGKATTYSYNNRNLPSSITLPSGTNISLTYDDLGRITNAVDPIGTITYTYDKNGRVIGTAQIISGTTKTISRQYDLLGRLIQFTDAAGNVLKYAYDAAGNLITLTYPDGKNVTYNYDAARRLTSVTDWASRVTSYTYDMDSRVATITRPDQSTETFTYDAAGQITQSTDLTASLNVIHNVLYAYDADNEITGENTTPAPGIYHPANLTLTVDADNRLATINTQAAVYDNNGNLTSATIPGSTISSLTYDARNRLISAGGITNAYDAENRRISVTSSAGTNIYVINPNAGLDQILVKTAPNGTVTRYVYGLGLIGEETGSDFTTYHYDHRGSTTALTDIKGNILNTFSYGPNGEPVGFNPATAPTPFLYGGRYGVSTDPNGLCYMRTRYYLPAICRFINQDTVLGNIGSGNSMNRFVYANGDPIDKNDPFGLAAQPLANPQIPGPFASVGIPEPQDYCKDPPDPSKAEENLNQTLDTAKDVVTWVPPLEKVGPAFEVIDFIRAKNSDDAHAALLNLAADITGLVFKGVVGTTMQVGGLIFTPDPTEPLSEDEAWTPESANPSQQHYYYPLTVKSSLDISDSRYLLSLPTQPLIMIPTLVPKTKY